MYVSIINGSVARSIPYASDWVSLERVLIRETSLRACALENNSEESLYSTGLARAYVFAATAGLLSLKERPEGSSHAMNRRKIHEKCSRVLE